MSDQDSQRFKLDMARFGAKAAAKPNIVVRKVALDLLRGIVLDTPVDTGRARANWQASVGSPIISQVDYAGGPGGAAYAALAEGARTIQAAGQGDDPQDVVIFLSNNVPYIDALEHGHSAQAPAGMVRRNLARFPYLVQEAASDPLVDQQAELESSR